MKSLVVTLLLLLPTAAFADATPQAVQDLVARAVLRAAVEREQLYEQVQQLQQELQSKKDAAPAAPAK